MENEKQDDPLVGMWAAMDYYGGLGSNSGAGAVGYIKAKICDGAYLVKGKTLFLLSILNCGPVYHFFESQEDMLEYVSKQKAKVKKQAVRDEDNDA